MTNDSLNEALKRLTGAVRQGGAGAVEEIDDALAEVTAHRSPTYIGALLLLLDDDAEYDEGMFSLIHAAEAFDDDVYVTELLSVLPEMRTSAPRWASIVLMRALNNEASRASMARAVRGAPTQAKQAIEWLCEKINERSPAFMQKTLPVLMAAKN